MGGGKSLNMPGKYIMRMPLWSLERPPVVAWAHHSEACTIAQGMLERSTSKWASMYKLALSSTTTTHPDGTH